MHNPEQLLKTAHDLGYTVTLLADRGRIHDVGFSSGYAPVATFDGSRFILVYDDDNDAELVEEIHNCPQGWNLCTTGSLLYFTSYGADSICDKSVLANIGHTNWLDVAKPNALETRELALRMALGNCRVNKWCNMGRTIGGLFREITPQEQSVVTAWETILNAPNEPLTRIDNDVARRGSGVAEECGFEEPAVIAGFLSYIAKLDWMLTPRIYDMLEESCILNSKPDSELTPLN